MTSDSSSLRSASPLAAIEARLAAGEGLVAARMVTSAVAHGTFAADRPLGVWFAALDEAPRTKLVSGFAHYPCFACQQGKESCDACGGSGFTAVARVCAACAGLGVKRCDFCSGSGLATYIVMPPELWPSVLVARASRAAKYLRKLAAQPAPSDEPGLTRRIEDLNKLLGVLENAVVAARQLGASDALAPQVVAQFVACTRRPAEAGVATMRQALASLSRHLHDASGALPPVDAENAAAKAEFYEDLSQSPRFDGTGLAHPFLPGPDDDGGP